MRSLALALAFAFALVAGCASPSSLSPSGGAAAGAPEPYYKQYSGAVEPNLDKSFDLAVQERATLVNVTLALATRSGGVAGAAPSPAQLTVELLAPDGRTAKSATVSAQDPAAVLLLDAPHAGTYRVHLSGNGLSSALQGTQYGASYVLILQTEYA